MLGGVERAIGDGEPCGRGFQGEGDFDGSLRCRDGAVVVGVDVMPTVKVAMMRGEDEGAGGDCRRFVLRWDEAGCVKARRRRRGGEVSAVTADVPDDAASNARLKRLLIGHLLNFEGRRWCG